MSSRNRTRAKQRPGRDQRVVQVPDVGQVAGKDDFAPVGVRDAVRDGQETVQMFVAVRPGPQQVIGILDDKGVGAADEKPREDLVGRQRAGVARDHHPRLCTEPPRHRAQDAGADQPGLAGSRRSVQHQNGGRRGQVMLDETGHAALKLR